MADAAIWWYPNDTAGLVKIDLGWPFSDLHETPEREVTDAPPSDQPMRRLDRGGRARVRFIREQFSSRVLAGKLRSLQAHLDKGLPVSVAADADAAWAAFVSGYTLPPNRKNIPTFGNAFAVYGAAAPSAGDRIVINSPNPERNWEELVVQSYGAGSDTIVCTTPTVYHYATGPAFVRNEWFFPICYLPEDRVGIPIVTSDHRYNWTLDLELVTAPSAVAALWTPDGVPGLGGTVADPQPYDEPAAGGTLQGIINTPDSEEGALFESGTFFGGLT